MQIQSAVNLKVQEVFKSLSLKLQEKEPDYLFTKSHNHTSLSTKIENLLRTENTNIKNRIINEFIGFGPLQDLLEDEAINEILIMGPKNIVYEKQGQLFLYHDCFLSEHSFLRIVDKLAKNFFKAISFENPTGNGHWRDYRVHIIAPPLSSVYNISLRKKAGFKLNSLEKLLTLKTMTQQEFDFLQNALVSRKNILVSGATSSGKTTFIQCLINDVSTERCLILEDTQELDLPNPYSTRLVCPARDEQYQISFSMQDLVKEALRMRPDRIILGEARGSEAKDYIQALSTGHRGCVASLHAANTKEALFRLECLILQGSPQWSTKVVRQLIASGIDIVVQLKRTKNGHRQITEMVKICGLEEEGLLLEPVFLL